VLAPQRRTSSRRERKRFDTDRSEEQNGLLFVIAAARTRFLLNLALAVGLFALPVSGASAADRLPDLGKAKLSDIHIEKTADGRRLLRFTSTIVNVGSGPFEVRGQRASTSEVEMSAVQRIYDTVGGYRDMAMSPRMFYAGDGHDHWHVRDLESSELIRSDNGVKVGSGAKRGFCLVDSYAYAPRLPGAPQSKVYTGCGQASSLSVTTGISVGWADVYGWDLAHQYVDITGLVAGRYRLVVTADPVGAFTESNRANNSTWADLQLKGNGTSLRVVAYGPAA
jgi:lysyl oxidase